MKMTTTAAAADLELSLAGVPLDLSLDELLDLAVPGVPADDDFAFTLFHESDGEDSPRASAVDDHMDVTKLLPTMASDETESVTFVEKTYYMVNTCASRLVCWNATGMGFFILDAAAFARDVLPEFFKHRNLHAFVTELTLHGFRKTVRRHKTRAIECLEFRHAHFVRGDASQLRKIARRSSAPCSPLRAASSPSSVLDEAMASDGEDGDDDAEDDSDDSAGESMGDLKSEISELKDEVQQTQQLFDKLIGALVHHNNAEAASAQVPVHPFMMCPPPAFAMFGMAPFAPGMHPGFFHPMSFAMGAVPPAVGTPAVPNPVGIDVEDDDFMAEFFPTLE